MEQHIQDSYTQEQKDLDRQIHKLTCWALILIMLVIALCALGLAVSADYALQQANRL